eukprot:TRINITY_DN14579_c0_g1_i1.p1 TRINITY_DN14579_c0_g1~~TRINITY_DN14579_c0_g1_i1.p1  ORF type:complete len:220 (+),score=96.15 TRINITY_DN14579_c0_g1_i1:44-703(+)
MPDEVVSVDWNRRVKESLKKQQGEKKEDEVEEIQVYDPITDYGLLKPFVNLKVLGIHQSTSSAVRITTLKDFPPFPHLTDLTVCDHYLADLPADFAQRYPSLTTLSLTNNKFYSPSALQPLKDCTNLTTLEVDDNPFTASKDTDTPYRDELFKLVPTLQVIDGLNRDGTAVTDEEEDEEEEDEEDDEEEDEEDSEAPPKPPAKRKRDDQDDEECRSSKK